MGIPGSLRDMIKDNMLLCSLIEGVAISKNSLPAEKYFLSVHTPHTSPKHILPSEESHIVCRMLTISFLVPKAHNHHFINHTIVCLPHISLFVTSNGLCCSLFLHQRRISWSTMAVRLYCVTQAHKRAR